MTTALVPVLVMLAALAWLAAGHSGHPRAVGPRAGSGARSGADGPLSLRRLGWLAARQRRRGAEWAEAEALELLDGLAPALRAGLPPVAALRLVMSSRTEGEGPRTPGSRSRGATAWFGLETAAARGEPLAPVWSAHAESVDSDDLRILAAAWSLCETLGSPLAPTVTTVAEVVRRRRAVRHRITAALAGPQATMRVLTALPLSGPLVAVAVGVSPADLYAGASGLSSLGAGLFLLLLGRTWALRMVRATTREQPAGEHRRRRERSDARR